MSVSRSFIFVICLFLSQSGLAQGINFLEGGFDKTLQTAKAENKLMFLEVYLNGCHHCEALAPILKEKEVGDVFNPAFASMKVEANLDESKYIQQSRKITYPEFPLFFFFDQEGNLIHQAAPTTDNLTKEQLIQEVIRHAKEALDPKTRTTNYPARFDGGDRDLMFLINYAKNAKAMLNYPRLTQIADTIGKMFVLPQDLEHPTGLFILNRIINDTKNPMAQYFFKHLDNYKAKFSAKEVNETGLNILDNTLRGLRAGSLPVADVQEIRRLFPKFGVTPDIASKVTVLAEINANFREKTHSKAAARLNEYIKASKMSFPEYAYFVRHFNENTKDVTDPMTTNSVVQWTKNGLALLTKPEDKNKPEVADLYLEQSVAYSRLKNKVEAKKSADMALKVAQTAKVADTKKYTDWLQML